MSDREKSSPVSLKPAHIRIRDGSQWDGCTVLARIESDGFALVVLDGVECLMLPNEYEEVQTPSRPVFATVTDRRAVRTLATEPAIPETPAGNYASAFDLTPEDYEC